MLVVGNASMLNLLLYVITVSKIGHTPARPLLDYRQARFAQRLLARPQGGEGPEEILERDGAVAERLRAASGVRLEEAVG